MELGISGLTVSTADRTPTLGSVIPRDWARSIAFWQMSTFVTQVRCDVDRCVRHQQRVAEAGYIHHENMGEAASGSQPPFLAQRGAQQIVGVQMPLHQRPYPAFGNHVDSAMRRSQRFRHIDDLDTAQIRVDVPCRCVDAIRVANQDRRDDGVIPRKKRTAERLRLFPVR